MEKAVSAIEQGFAFYKDITVGIRDINYGGHVGNDVYLSYCQEARIAYFAQLGCAELDIGGCGIILVRSELEYRSELFHGDQIKVYCRIPEIKNSSFVMEYCIEKQDGSPALQGKTVLVAFDYAARKITRVPQAFRDQVASFEA